MIFFFCLEFTNSIFYWTIEKMFSCCLIRAKPIESQFAINTWAKMTNIFTTNWIRSDCAVEPKIQKSKFNPQNDRSAYLAAWPALRICVKMLDNSSRFRLPRMCVPKRALQNFNARLSLEIFNNSMHRFSYGACPTTSRIKSRTKRVCLVWICRNREWIDRKWGGEM